MKKIKAGIVFGGRSGEHEVSIHSAASVVEAIDKKKYAVTLLGITQNGAWKTLPMSSREGHEDIYSFLKRVLRTGKKCSPVLDSGKGHFMIFEQKKCFSLNVVFPVLHGTFGEDGTIQGLFEMMNIPYVGGGVLGCAAGMDKDIMKRLFLCEGLPVVRWQSFYCHETFSRIKAQLVRHFTFPVFVKPANLGSSVGISKVSETRGLKAALSEAFSFDNKIIVEQGYDVREIECSIMGNFEYRVSLPGEIIPAGDSFYSYKAKYEQTGSQLFIPAELNKSVTRKIQDYAVRAFRCVEGRGMARVDFFITKDSGRIFVNELNMIPGFTAISMFPKMFEKSGLKYPQIIDSLFQLAFEMYEMKNTKKYSS